jgi:putative transposase
MPPAPAITQEYRRRRHLVSAAHAHLLFVAGAVSSMRDMLRSCQDPMRTVRRGFGATLRELNGQDDHVHLLAGYPPKVAAPAPVNNLTGVPARRLRSQFAGQVNRHIRPGHFWSPSYFATSCSGAPLSRHPAAHRAAKNAG